jgi:hypothetical protein
VGSIIIASRHCPGAVVSASHVECPGSSDASVDIDSVEHLVGISIGLKAGLDPMGASIGCSSMSSRSGVKTPGSERALGLLVASFGFMLRRTLVTESEYERQVNVEVGK